MNNLPITDAAELLVCQWRNLLDFSPHGISSSFAMDLLLKMTAQELITKHRTQKGYAIQLVQKTLLSWAKEVDGVPLDNPVIFDVLTVQLSRII